ncbi:hypothetical protein B0T16DRAFT_57556 [Cercophora newfieldiana]|uniref:Uncharacterized protein n=1 Tax=Cercophora newfieldiana TaxID=92897 RepID=A0AA39YRH3_9PEZI|nr:hypothetical protein B0T16DRAFT_57556 [Cercophora newfieldiana]
MDLELLSWGLTRTSRNPLCFLSHTAQPTPRSSSCISVFPASQTQGEGEKTRLLLDPRPTQSRPTTRYYELGRSQADSQALSNFARSRRNRPVCCDGHRQLGRYVATRIACPAMAHKTAEGVRIASHRIAGLWAPGSARRLVVPLVVLLAGRHCRARPPTLARTPPFQPSSSQLTASHSPPQPSKRSFSDATLQTSIPTEVRYPRSTKVDLSFVSPAIQPTTAFASPFGVTTTRENTETHTPGGGNLSSNLATRKYSSSKTVWQADSEPTPRLS